MPDPPKMEDDIYGDGCCEVKEDPEFVDVPPMDKDFVNENGI
jgi:hypothetical protein